MKVGFAGAGNMVGAIARGWAAGGGPEQMLFIDAVPDRARALADEVGGEALETPAELVEASDLVVLGFKPNDLDDAAAGLSGAGAVLSMLGATPLSRIAEAFPGAAAMRIMPNQPVAVRRGVVCLSVADGVDGGLRDEVKTLLEKLGTVVELDEELIDGATAIMSCSPAYFALVAEALADAGIAQAELEPELAQRMVRETMAGTAELLAGVEPAELRRMVASPGGSTEVGLEALERAGVAEAFADAVKASLARMRP
jgi:pyrroline-5-carboxylate reductase